MPHAPLPSTIQALPSSCYYPIVPPSDLTNTIETLNDGRTITQPAHSYNDPVWTCNSLQVELAIDASAFDGTPVQVASTHAAHGCSPSHMNIHESSSATAKMQPNNGVGVYSPTGFSGQLIFELLELFSAIDSSNSILP